MLLVIQTNVVTAGGDDFDPRSKMATSPAGTLPLRPHLHALLNMTSYRADKMSTHIDSFTIDMFL